MSPKDFDEEPGTEPLTTDQLDLHPFQPSECADVVEEFVHAAQAEGYRLVRIIHGKGTGTLRRTVHSVLEKHELVVAFRLADEREGGWGATLVTLRPPRQGR